MIFVFFSFIFYLNKPEASLELVVTVTATIASTGTTYLTKNSYITSEIKWGYKFAECITPELQKKGPYKGQYMYTVDDDQFDILIPPNEKFYDNISVCEYVRKYGCNNPHHEECIKNWEKLIREQNLTINDPKCARFRIECLAEPRYRLFKVLTEFSELIFFVDFIWIICFYVGLHKSIYKRQIPDNKGKLKRRETWKDAPSDAFGMTETSEETEKYRKKRNNWLIVFKLVHYVDCF